MRPIQTLRRFVANADELVSAVRRLHEALDNQSTAINERLGRLHEGLDNQSTQVNERGDRLQKIAETLSNALTERLDRLQESADNQSTEENKRLDQILSATNNKAEATESALLAISRQLGELIVTVGGDQVERRKSSLRPPPSAKSGASKLALASSNGHMSELEEDVPYPKIDLGAVPNPIPELLSAPEFGDTVNYFRTCPAASYALLSEGARALIYTLVRNQCPEHVVEIGTFRGGTAEGICRALAANRKGVLHTIGPFDSEHFREFYETWPVSLKSRVLFYATDSMAFYMEATRQDVHPDLALIDGNHDYEYALFDIQCAAKLLRPSGFILVDNVSQVGPYYATIDFLAANPEWVNCSARSPRFDFKLAFDPERHLVPTTDFIVLRAPAEYSVGLRPKNFGEITLAAGSVSELNLNLAAPATGTLHVQCILRGFGTKQVEQIGGTSARLTEQVGEVNVSLAPALRLEGDFDNYRVEPWLIWDGASPLKLARPPSVL